MPVNLVCLEAGEPIILTNLHTIIKVIALNKCLIVIGK